MEVALGRTDTHTHFELASGSELAENPLLPPGGLFHLLLVSFFWLVGVVAQLTLTSYRAERRVAGSVFTL